MCWMSVMLWFLTGLYCTLYCVLYQATPVHYTALHALPAPEQLLLWFSTLWLAGLMARVKAWLLVPEILGTDLDNTEEELLLLLLLLMLRLLLTYLRSGPSLSLSTETQELQSVSFAICTEARPSNFYSANGPITLRPVVNISVVCLSSAREGLWVATSPSTHRGPWCPGGRSCCTPRWGSGCSCCPRSCLPPSPSPAPWPRPRPAQGH